VITACFARFAFLMLMKARGPFQAISIRKRHLNGQNRHEWQTPRRTARPISRYDFRRRWIMPNPSTAVAKRTKALGSGTVVPVSENDALNGP
jgi:hypothetical protein